MNTNTNENVRLMQAKQDEKPAETDDSSLIVSRFKIKVLSVGKELTVKYVPISSLKTPLYRMNLIEWTEDRIDQMYFRLPAPIQIAHFNPLIVNKNPKRYNYVVGPYFYWVNVKYSEKDLVVAPVVYVNLSAKLEKEAGDILDKMLYMKETGKERKRLLEICK